MRVAYITAGAASMICGSCLKDNALVSALRQQGRDCILIPTYTPLRTDEPSVSFSRVFFSGLSVYLEQKIAWFRRMPPWLERWLSSSSLLRCISRLAIRTRAEELGELTISMLRGSDGNQAQEVESLVTWLQREYSPDVVGLSNILLSGMIPALKTRLGCPIVVTLQGDDIFLDHLPPSYKQTAVELIRRNASFVDAYIVPCAYYADHMSTYLGLPRDSMHVIYPGINVKTFEQARDTAILVSNDKLRDRKATTYTIGYLARVCPEKGLHVLVEAVSELIRRGLPVRLEVAGYMGTADREYYEQLRRRIYREGWHDRFSYWGEVSYDDKVRFLLGLDVLSVPTVYREPKGLYVLEAWLAGVPVVQPRHGSFPELVERSGAGICVEPENPQALAAALQELLQDESRRRELGQRGRQAVLEFFHNHRMAEETWQLWTNLVQANLGMGGRFPSEPK
ncbi:MAG: glycosyltransferase family 4 protein [Gemmatales bacterium]|nr:glycosyltransferase family 4 protein [Gemmatales bacterium]MDW7994687.1 glycosyltransferase family 4 protein [Gemmatales bacterium]